jgi:hypothetical protein
VEVSVASCARAAAGNIRSNTRRLSIAARVILRRCGRGQTLCVYPTSVARSDCIGSPPRPMQELLHNDPGRHFLACVWAVFPAICDFWGLKMDQAGERSALRRDGPAAPRESCGRHATSLADRCARSSRLAPARVVPQHEEGHVGTTAADGIPIVDEPAPGSSHARLARVGKTVPATSPVSGARRLTKACVTRAKRVRVKRR